MRWCRALNLCLGSRRCSSLLVLSIARGRPNETDEALPPVTSVPLGIDARDEGRPHTYFSRSSVRTVVGHRQVSCRLRLRWSARMVAVAPNVPHRSGARQGPDRPACRTCIARAPEHRPALAIRASKEWYEAFDQPSEMLTALSSKIGR